MFAALHIPDLSTVAALRSCPDATEAPCAVLAAAATKKPNGNLQLASLNRAARFAGLDAGWPLNRALVRCPNLRLLPRDPLVEAQLLEELIDLGGAFTPDLEVTAADAVLLDFSNRRGDPMPALAAANLPGILVWHALAATPDLASLAVRYEQTQGRRIAPADLAPVPIAVLQALAIDPAPLELLDLWGLKTLGDFMALPRQALIERLGLEAGRWHDVVGGKTCRLLRLHRLPESLGQRMEFDDAVVSLDPLVFAIKRLLHTLTGRLAARYLAASSLGLRLLLETGGEVFRQIRLPEPQNTVEGMLQPLQTWLESLRLDAAIAGLELDAETTFATAAQREWFGRQLPQPQRWAETLAKLEALLGPEKVGIPVLGASHAPEHFKLWPAAGPPPPATDFDEARQVCTLPLQRYRPPRAIAVAHEFRGRHPWPLALLNGPFPGPLRALRGPFPLSGQWWDPETSWQRLEWDVQADSQELLRLVFQVPDRWQLEGIYR